VQLGIRFRARLALDRVRAWFGVPLRCEVRGTQDEVAQRVSEFASVHISVGGREALLCYGRPSARGRKVFGALVPYGELWRTGANEPTVLRLPFPAEIAGIRAPRGTYSLYTIPDPHTWTLVVNRATRQWGLTKEERGPRGRLFASAYTPAVARAELGRASVESRATSHVETLTARCEPVSADMTLLLFEWENTQLRIPIRALRVRR
jgi:hypothetical protein